MKIAGIYSYAVNCPNLYKNNISNSTYNATAVKENVDNLIRIPLNHRFGNIIHFGTEEFMDPDEEVDKIDFEQYKKMSEAKKEHWRGIYKIFPLRKDILGLYDSKIPEHRVLPLQTVEDMDNFLEVAKWYNQFKDHTIVCLGRSPKWFLNASLWMKDGIPNYKFCAFSGFWYRPDKQEGMVPMQFKNENDEYEICGPTEEQYEAYKKYLIDNEIDPKSLVEDYEKSGKKVIITDYVETGKGMTSFLEVMSRFAQEQDVLEEFCESIEIAKIGCLEYTRERLKLEDTPEPPEVHFPELMKPYTQPSKPWETSKIKQQYFNMDKRVFDQMLYNQNSNECRSTYYPHYAWNKFNPSIYRTNRVKNENLDKIAELLTHMKSNSIIFDFPQIMSDYRNLLNFRILDGLERRGLLKDKHKTKD